MLQEILLCFQTLSRVARCATRHGRDTGLAARARVVSVPRFIKVPPKEAPPEPVEKPLDEGVAAAWTTALAELRGPTESEEARRERARRERALLIAKPPQLRS